MVTSLIRVTPLPILQTASCVIFRVLLQWKRSGSRENWRTWSWTRSASTFASSVNCRRMVRRWSGSRTARRFDRTSNTTSRSMAEFTDSSSRRRRPRTSEYTEPIICISALQPSWPLKVDYSRSFAGRSLAIRYNTLTCAEKADEMASLIYRTAKKRKKNNEKIKPETQ